MKEIKLNKKILKVAVISTFLFVMTISNKSFGAELEANLSNEYKEWLKLSNEEKMQSYMPQTTYGEVTPDILRKYRVNKKSTRLYSLFTINNSLNAITANVSDSRYTLQNRMNIRVENQGSTTECWAFSSLKSVETNIALRTGNTQLQNFSERHMDYATTRTFTDGINPIAYNRELGNGGLPIVAYAYLTNGTGAVLESDLPFEDNETRISLSNINKKADTVVTDYNLLPTIVKAYNKDAKGNTISVRYKDANGRDYSQEDLLAARNIIKDHLVRYGAVSSITASNHTEYYNSNNIFKATAYNCNSANEKRDHAITIVGWDDNYSRNNFRDGARPSTDGAYIVLNSYGENNFDNGYIYISYEDYFIESELYGVQATRKVDYDKIYQHDFYGGIFQIGTKSLSTGYYAVTYQRDIPEEELLTSVGVNLSTYASLEIYANPTGSSLVSSDLIKIGESNGELCPGFHRIDVDTTKLNSSEFAIVVKQTSSDGTFSFKVETKVDGTAFQNVRSEHRSYYSLGANAWQRLSEVSVDDIDTENADVCIKAYTTRNVSTEPDEPDNPDIDKPTDPDQDTPTKPDDDNNNDDKDNPTEPEKEFNVNDYKIENDKYIVNIDNNTTKSEFLSHFSSNLELYVVDENDNEIKDDDIISTGMTLVLEDETEYLLIVKGDIDKDGKISVLDVSKIMLQYTETEGSMITDQCSLKACDMDLDGKISILDVSKLIILYNSL